MSFTFLSCFNLGNKKNKRTIEKLYEQIKITEEDIVYFETLQFQVENADKSDLIEIKEELINSGLLKEKISNSKKKNKNNYYIAYFKKGRHNTKGKKSIVKYYKEGKIDKIYIYRDNNFILLSQNSFKEDKIILFMFNINDINEEEPFELTIEGDKLETIFKDNKTNRDILEYIKNNKLKITP